MGDDLADLLGDEVPEKRPPYKYGSDLHWLWGWGQRIDALLCGDPFTRYAGWAFYPDRLAKEAMRRLSYDHRYIIERIERALGETERAFRAFMEKDDEDSRWFFAEVLGIQHEEIDSGARVIAEKDSTANSPLPPTPEGRIPNRRLSFGDTTIEPSQLSANKEGEQSGEPHLIAVDLRAAQQESSLSVDQVEAAPTAINEPERVVDAPKGQKDAPPVPHWNPDTGELIFGGKVAKQVKNLRQAKNITTVLNAFQEESWPVRIDDPLPHPASAERTNKTVASLNNNLSGIRFSADGTGQGFRWGAL